MANGWDNIVNGMAGQVNNQGTSSNAINGNSNGAVLGQMPAPVNQPPVVPPKNPQMLGPQQSPWTTMTPMTDAQTGMQANPYGMNNTPTANEQAAGVGVQPFYSMLDANGNLKSSYAADPTKSQAFTTEQNLAESSSLSPWAQMQTDANNANMATQKDQSAAKTLGANDQAMQNIETQGGGAASGTAALLGAQGARADIMANQNINDTANKNNINIAQTDAQNKQGILGQVASAETAAQAANAATGQQDTTNANLYSTNRYNQQMGAYGAAQTANAQRSAAGGGKK